jgi:anti-sigma regulatory factor (Ser/Thr protein kinase)
MLYSERLPKSPGSAGAARELLERVRPEVPERVFDDARLLISELVSNSIEHVREDGEIEVRVALEESVLRVEVLDSGPGFEYASRDDRDGRGWGLHFAQLLARRWGKDTEDRSRVWFELTVR